MMEIAVISQHKRGASHEVCLRCYEKNADTTKIKAINSYNVLEPRRNATLKVTAYMNELTLVGLQANTLYHIEITCSIRVDGNKELQTGSVKFFTGN